jgi:hypothetical protein
MRTFLRRRENEPARTQNDAARLAEDIREIRRQIENTRMLFSMETDDDLLDAAIYQMQALQARYSYLLRRGRGEDFAATQQEHGKEQELCQPP